MRLSPSHADVWTRCSAMPGISQKAPTRQRSDDAIEGECASWLAEQVLTGKAATCADLVGTCHPVTNWQIDADMAHHVQGYVDHLTGREAVNHVEKFVSLTDFIGGKPDNYSIVGNTLYVDDLKYGFRIVEPHTLQLKVYAAAILLDQPHVTDIVLTIHQPRAYHPLGYTRSLEVTPQAIAEDIETVLNAATAALGGHGVFRAGDHCRYCPAVAVCHASAHRLYDVYDGVRSDVVRELSDAELSAELVFLETALTILKSRHESLEADAISRMGRGRLVPGWQVAAGRGQRRWSASADIVQVITGIDPRSDVMVTPAEMERRGVPKEVVNALTYTPETAPKLKRFNPEVTRKQFGEGN